MRQLEVDWGYNLFLQFYFFCVIGAALVTVVVSFTGILGVSPRTLTVGASGGIYGLLLAFGMLHGDSEVMLFPLPFLIKAKYFVIGIIFLALYGALSSAHGGGQSIAYMAHLGRPGLCLHLAEVHAPPGLRLRRFRAGLRHSQFVLSLEA